MNEFLSALAGGIVAGIFSLFAIKQQLGAERSLRKDEADEKIRNLLLALYHELKAVWNLYMERTGRALEDTPEDKPFVVTVPISEKYYVLYDANAEHIGSIPNAALRDKIITTYTSLKSLKDSYLYNNQYIESMAASGEVHARTGTYRTARVVKIKEPTMLSFGNAVRANHYFAKQSVTDLLPALEAYFATHPEMGKGDRRN
jgi:hypothetical protein